MSANTRTASHAPRYSELWITSNPNFASRSGANQALTNVAQVDVLDMVAVWLDPPQTPVEGAIYDFLSTAYTTNTV
jgi:hypothetical protein